MYKLPVTMDPIKYGKMIYFDKSTNTYLIQVTDKTIAQIKVEEYKNNVEIIKEGNPIIKYTDTLTDTTSNNVATFIRELGNKTYFYDENGEVVLVRIKNSTKFIKPKKPLPALAGSN